jgi:cobalamin biosynthetic protein CobC
MLEKKLDHGGNLDHHISLYGGLKSDWIDLSTGINQSSYPIPEIPKWVWENLPDKSLTEEFQRSARKFWKVPDDAELICANGTSMIISALPSLFEKGNVDIYEPSYNEYKSVFTQNGWGFSTENVNARILINPNNPDGKTWRSDKILNNGKLTIIDESFCDLVPQNSLIYYSNNPGVIVLKSFGKFWGLAGIRFGCAIGLPETLKNLKDILGPWPASGPALFIANNALSNHGWAKKTRERLNNNMITLDNILTQNGLKVIGGTSLFRLVFAPNAIELKNNLCKKNILTRTFPYSKHYLRLGIPNRDDHWKRVESAIKEFI